MTVNKGEVFKKKGTQQPNLGSEYIQG